MAGYRSKRELTRGVRLGCILKGSVKFALRILLGGLRVVEGHAKISVAEQLHESREAQTETEHLGGIGVKADTRRAKPELA